MGAPVERALKKIYSSLLDGSSLHWAIHSWQMGRALLAVGNRGNRDHNRHDDPKHEQNVFIRKPHKSVFKVPKPMPTAVSTKLREFSRGRSVSRSLMNTASGLSYTQYRVSRCGLLKLSLKNIWTKRT